MPSIFITGAASGIGFATARVFGRAGWRLGLADLTQEGLDAVRREPGLHDANLYVVDVTDANTLQVALADFCVGGRLDVMHNNAGILSVGRFSEIPLKRHHQIIDINVKGVINGAYAAYPYLKTARGLLINMSSASAIFGTPDFASYSASKFAVRGLTEALATEWARDGIGVCDVMPPFVKTPMLTAEEKNSGIVARLGVNLSAENVADEIFKVTTSRELHNPLTLQFRALSAVSKLIPDRANKAIMQFLSRP